MTRRSSISTHQNDPINPLDLLEECLDSEEFVTYRIAPEELVLDFQAEWCSYRIHFVWIEEVTILQIHSTFDLEVGEDANLGEVYKLLTLLNERVMVGHFELPEDTNAITYRNSVLVRICSHQGIEYLEDLLSIAVSECERFYPAFQFVILAHKTADEATSITMIDTVGEA